MKTNVLLLFLLFFTIKNIESQELNLHKSEVFKDIGRDSRLAFYDEDNSGNTFVLRKFYGGIDRKVRIYLLERYDSKLNKKESKEFLEKNIKELFVKNGYLHLILLEDEGKNKKFNYKVLRSPVQKFDFESFKLFLDKDAMLAHTVDVNKNSLTTNYFNETHNGYTGEVMISKNKNFIGLNLQLNNIKNETNRIAVFNLNFEKIFEHEVQQNLKDKRYEFNSFLIDDVDGSVYFLGKYKPNFLQKVKLSNEEPFSFNMFKINKDSEQVLEFKTGDNFISSLKLLESDNKLMCVGLYSTSENKATKGIAYYQIDKNSLSVHENNFLELKSKNIKNLNLKKVLVDQDENLYVAAEERYVVGTPAPGSQFSVRSSNQSFHFDNIHFAKIDNKGDLDWYYQLHKSQSSSRNYFVYFSYLFNLIDNKPYLVFNSNQKKILKDGELNIRSTSLDKMFLYALVFDQNGEYSLKLLDHDKSKKITFKTLQGLVNKNSFLLEGDFKKNKQILKLKQG
ncbi:hypothetical protein [Mesonia aestuariivivens]|uniref:Uncharacterized protein n=1 Tax=Mesonia aestuariivivens TaxID=2796128 RepID=A0ABS6W2D2_9FLAO|nr:hypothetical protein [Mesonia aestuariivivens]MBW2961676.1 hypothetical protein [Mesonia aestuariivivens]